MLLNKQTRVIIENLANQDVKVDILTGIQYLEAASRATSADDKKNLLAFMECLKTEAGKQGVVSTALSEELSALMHKYRDKRFAARYAKELTVVADRPKALFSAWYERFPRSCAAEPRKNRNNPFSKRQKTPCSSRRRRRSLISCSRHLF